MNALTVNGKIPFMGREIPVVLGGFGPDKRCMSDKTIAEIHRMRTPDIRRRILDNIDHFRSGVDCIDLLESVRLTHDVTICLQLGYTKAEISQADHIYILSERGYAKLIKIMDTDLAWEIHDKLIDEYFEMREEKRQAALTEYQRKRVEIGEKNARIRAAQILVKLANQYTGTTYEQVLNARATKELTGEYVLPLPQIEAPTYSAEEIGEQLGISGNMVGRLANRYNLKTDEYGRWYNDKARHCGKEVPSFRYYAKVTPILKAVLDEKENGGRKE